MLATQEQTAVTARFLRYEDEERKSRDDIDGRVYISITKTAVVEVGDQVIRFPIFYSRLEQKEYRRPWDGHEIEAVPERTVWVAWGDFGSRTEPGPHPPSVSEFHLGGDMGNGWGYEPWLHTYGIHKLEPAEPAALAATSCLYSDPEFQQHVAEATEHLAEIGPVNEREWLNHGGGRRHGE